MKKNAHVSSVLSFMIPAVICFFAISVFSCSPKKAEWTSPADAKELSLLESKTLENAISKKQRAELFFLWGQELAASAQSGTASEGTSASELNEKAIAAFEKVVDLDSVLVAESRFNLEILWKRQGQGGNGNSKDNQDPNDKQNKQNQQDKQNQNGSQDKQGQQGQQDKQSQQDKQGQQGKDNQAADKNTETEKDLSGLVRDKAGGKDIDDALKAEIDRKAAKQEAQAGGIRPVEKDW